MFFDECACYGAALNFLKQKIAIWRFFINENWWWESACTNQAENKQEFIDLMQRVKEFKEKWLISPMGEN